MYKIKFDMENSKYGALAVEVMENLVRRLQGVTIEKEISCCGITLMEVKADETAGGILEYLCEDVEILEMEY